LKALGEKPKKNKGPPPTKVAAFHSKIDDWLERLDKKLENDAIINRAIKNNAVVHQKELTETLKHFEDSLKYHHDMHEYQKKMRKAVVKMEKAEKPMSPPASEKKPDVVVKLEEVDSEDLDGGL
jgi:plasmid rolling circle replication initiator protein Rep